MSRSVWLWLTCFGIVSFVCLSSSETAPSEREFQFSLCQGFEGSDARIASVEVKTTLQCWRDCGEHPTCYTATVCHQHDDLTCLLFDDVFNSSVSCEALTVNSRCTTAILDGGCQNGGHYNKTTAECVCPEFWEGPLCETRSLPSPCFTGSTCLAEDMKYHKMHSGVTYCCPPHAVNLFQMCSNKCGPCTCMDY